METGSGLGAAQEKTFEGFMNAEKDEEQTFRATKYPKLTILTGGKGPPSEPTDDWLSAFEVGTTFVSMPQVTYDVDYELFFVVHKQPEVVLLKWILPDGKVWDKYVHPASFSKKFKPGVILGVNKGNEDDKGQRDLNRSPNLVLDEAVQGEHSLPEEIE